MSSLTEEQRRRVEENRQKAMRRKAASAARAASESISLFKLSNNNNTMNSLTEGQRRLIESNRRKALERRAASAARAAGVSGSGSSDGAIIANATDSSKKKTDVTGSCKMMTTKGSLTEQQRHRIEENKRKALERRAASATRTTTDTGTSSGGVGSVFTNTTTANSSKSKKQIVVMAGLCTMVTRNRFTVNIGLHHPQLISIFKSIDGAQYEVESKRWTFPFLKHAALLSAVQCLRSEVSIFPLPPFVQRAFSNISPRVPPHISLAVDLRNVDSTLVVALLKFQFDGVQFGINRQGRCLIADDMGLGKSIQALGIAHYYFLEWPLLIVCPSTMRYSWRESIWKWLPSISTVCVVETAKDDLSNAQVMITSYDLLPKRCSQDFMRCGVVIMDESHHLKNYKAARTQAALPIMKNARRLIMLSGTPALSRPIELYTQISAINANLVSYTDYGIRYCDGGKNAWGWDFSGSSHLEELRLFLEETVMIRRLKSQVLEQLPPKMRKVLVLDPDLVDTQSQLLKSTANAYYLNNSNDNNDKSLNGLERRGKLLEYYAETASVKLKAVTGYLKEMVKSERKFICFSHHKVMMDGICAMLEEMSCRYIRIDGGTCAQDRKIAVDMFQERSDIMVAVLSITTASSGVTLTAASLVVFAELYWNPGILMQAEDRAHRIGQSDSVLVEYLLAKGTADDVMWPMVQEKLKVLNGAGLSKDDLSDAAATSAVQKEGTGK